MEVLYFVVHLLVLGNGTYDLGENWALKAKYKLPDNGEVKIEYHTNF